MLTHEVIVGCISVEKRAIVKNEQIIAKSRKPRRQQNGLVMCLGGIGDTVLSFAMLRRLRQQQPKARLTALVMWPPAAELIEDLGIFDEIITHNFQEDRSWRSLVKLIQLHFRRFDWSVLAYPTNRLEFKLASWLIHAKRRIGHRYENSGWLNNACCLLTDVIDQTVPTHNVDENLKLLAVLPGRILPGWMRCASGVDNAVDYTSDCMNNYTAGYTNEIEIEPGKSVDIRLGRWASSYDRFADHYLSKISWPYLGIHAGCASFKNMADRRWPAECFAELCRLAHEQLGLTPLLFGSGNEIVLNEYIVRLAGIGHVVRTPSIRHTAVIVQRCGVFVSNDSALAHMASALSVPTVMIVGPTDAEMVRPYGARGVAMNAGLACSPCYRPCRKPLECSRREYPFACLREITPQAVLEQVRNLLSVVSTNRGYQVQQQQS